MDTQIRRRNIDVGIDLYWLRFFTCCGDNVGTKSVDPDQARQSVKLIWMSSVRVRNFDTDIKGKSTLKYWFICPFNKGWQKNNENDKNTEIYVNGKIHLNITNFTKRIFFSLLRSYLFLYFQNAN